MGDCDWSVWDLSIPKANCSKPTVSQTLTKYDVLGNDLGSSFEDNGKLIFLFGDTIGASHDYVPNYASQSLEDQYGKFMFNAHDPIAWSTTTQAENGLLLNFFPGTSGKTLPLFVEPQYPTPQHFPDGTTSTSLPMGADETPNSGISINGQIYIVVNANADMSLKYPHLNSYSVLVRFDQATNTFAAGRTISQTYYPAQSPNSKITGTPGHFVDTALQELPTGFGTSGPGAHEAPPLGAAAWEPGVLMFGEGQFFDGASSSGSSVYLSFIPESDFWSGTDASGKNATAYFSGLQSGHPTWSAQESAAVPVVYDNPANLPVPSGPPGLSDPGTVGEISVTYSSNLGLWFMTYNGGRKSKDTTGIYFTYASAPWGPWATPQLIFNACRDHGYGNFIYYYYDKSKPDDNICPSVTSPGPAGPTIGDQTQHDPTQTSGQVYAPEMIGRFTEIQGSILKIYYLMSTWNPYTSVLMSSQFKISQTP